MSRGQNRILVAFEDPVRLTDGDVWLTQEGFVSILKGLEALLKKVVRHRSRS